MNDLDRALDPATSTAELAVIGQSIFRSYAFSDNASMDLWVALLGNPSLHASNMNLLLAHVRVAPKGRPGLHEEAVEAFASNPSVPFALLLGEINLAVPVALLIDDLFTMGEGGARAQLVWPAAEEVAWLHRQLNAWMGRVSPDRQQALRTALYPADEEVLTDNISTYQSVLRRAFLGGLPKEPVASSPEALAWLFAYIDAMEARGIRPLRITQALRTLLVPMFPPLVEAR